jgi:DNA-binding protein
MTTQLSLEDEVLKLVHPSNMMIAGPTGSGKTRFVLQLLKHRMYEVPRSELNTDDLNRQFPDRLIWVYGEWQPMYKEVKTLFPKVEFMTEPDFELDPKQRNLVVLDDVMTRVKNDKNLVNLFCRGSHHRNASIIYIVQNLFVQGTESRTIHLNTQYFVLMKSNRDLGQITRLGMQLYDNDRDIRQAFKDSYIRATKKPHTYLLVDVHHGTHEALKLRSGIFPGGKGNVYVPNVVLERLRKRFKKSINSDDIFFDVDDLLESNS